MASISFGYRVDMYAILPPTDPAAYIVAYDLDGVLKQKDHLGVVTLVGSGAGGPQGVPGPVGPAGLTWSGFWSATSSYSINYAVGYGSASWWCISGVTGATGNDSPDIDTTHWALLAAQGSPGGQGGQGEHGLDGPRGLTGATGPSGDIFTFSSNLTVSLANGKTFGKYENLDVIPSYGLTLHEVLQMAIVEALEPTTTLTSTTTVQFNQVDIDNVLHFSYIINSLGATVSLVDLSWRRGNVGSWVTLTQSTSATSFTHSYVDSGYNSSVFNYRYYVSDTAAGYTYSYLNITPVTYVVPSATLPVSYVNGLSPETNLLRELGNIESNMSGSITRNSPYIDLVSYDLQYRKNSGSWVTFSTNSSIGTSSTSIPTTNHNATSSLFDSTSISYRVVVTDSYTQSYLATSTINFYSLIFYGPTSSVPTNSSQVRSLPSRIFINGSNPFTLNTGTIYSNFIVATPQSVSSLSVLDTSTNVPITMNSTTFSVANYYGTLSTYKVFSATQAVPYTSSHPYQITKI